MTLSQKCLLRGGSRAPESPWKAETDEFAYLSVGALTSIAWIAFIPTQYGCAPGFEGVQTHRSCFVRIPRI